MAQLLFVYNAESGLANALIDTGRRVFQPQSYACAICMVTYGPFGMKRDWKRFIASLPYDVSFIHTDELPADLAALHLNYPTVIRRDEKQMDIR